MKRQIAGLLLARGLGSLAQAVVMVVLARSIPVDNFGALGVLIAIMAFAVIFFDFGASALLSRSVARREFESAKSILRVVRISSWLLSFVSVVTLGGVAFAEPSMWWLPIVALSLALEKTVEAESGILVAGGKTMAPSGLVACRRFFVLAITLLATMVSPALAIGGYAVGSLVSISVSAWVSSRLSSAVLAQPEVLSRPYSVRDVFVGGSHFMIGNLTGMVRMLDVVIVSLLGSLRDAAHYSAASKLATPLFLVPQVLGSVLLPRAATRPVKTLQRDSYVISAAAAGMSAGALAVSPFAERVTVLLYGAQYVDAAPVLAVTLVSFPWIAFSSTLGSILQGAGHEKYVSINGFVAAVVTIVAMVLGFLAMGTVGVAVGLFFSYFAKYVALQIRIFRLSAD